MSSVLDECCRILGCRPDQSVEYLKHPIERLRVTNTLNGQMVRTLYRDRLGFKHTFQMNSITNDGAHTIQAYGRLRRPWNMSVCAYYFARHNIRLRHPKVPCAIERWNFGEKRYYPLELLEIVTQYYDNDDDDDDNDNITFLKNVGENERANELPSNSIDNEKEDDDEIISTTKNNNKSEDQILENALTNTFENLILANGHSGDGGGGGGNRGVETTIVRNMSEQINSKKENSEVGQWTNKKW